ncbi:ionotropic receptor 25a-like, partial [Teleopsis dalmanni]|uniref:ionotropic receptor 25a-like n=1 Tax=Teleopsis dalmanni TaxID=139649 RepID=UPI0018CF6E5F
LKERKADMSLGSFRYTLERCEELTGALPYYQSWTVYAVLLMQPYSSLEILGFAFDTKTWLCLFISLCFTLILTYILHRYIKKSWLARIILGIPRPQTPLTNLVSVFLGVPITPMPSSTYTRFVIIHWFIYGLLIRTAYQSLLFQLLQTDMYQEPPKTLSDLISRHYTLIITTTAFDQVKRVPHIDETDIIFNNSTFEPDTFAIVAENSNKRLAGVSPMDFLKFYVVKNNKRGIFFVLPEKIFTQHITMYFTKHTYLIDRFNYIFMQLRSQGLIDYWASKSIEKIKWPSKKVDSCYPLNKSVNVQQSSWTLLDFEVQD